MRFAEILLEPRRRRSGAARPDRRRAGCRACCRATYPDWRQAPDRQPWDYVPLRLYQELLAEEGFSLDVIEDNPPMDALRLGGPGATRSSSSSPRWCGTWAGSGSRCSVTTGCRCSAGCGLVAHARPRRRTRGRLRLRGDRATRRCTAAGRADDLWDNLAWFLERVVPVAEEAGVRLAMHPDDPPLPCCAASPASCPTRRRLSRGCSSSRRARPTASRSARATSRS